MPSALESIEIVGGILLAVLLLAVAWTYLRRRYIARGESLTVCGLKQSSTDRWHVGLLRFGDNALEWYKLGGVSLRPHRRWQRQTLLLEAPAPLGEESIAILPGAWRVPCATVPTRSGAGAVSAPDAFELALQAPAYTALRSWQEASPPGFNVNVA